MMIASTVFTSALTTPFSPITRRPATFSSPPTSHSIWMESEMLNLPSTFERSPAMAKRVIGVPSDCDSGPEPFFPDIEASFVNVSCRYWTISPGRPRRIVSEPRRLPCRRKRRFFRLSIVPDRVSNSRGGDASTRVAARRAPRLCGRSALWTSVGSEGADEAGDPFVVRLERILAENRLALRVVQLEVDPVDPIVLALQVGLTNELAAQPRPRRLRRYVLGLLDRLVVGDAVHHVASGQLVVDAAIGPDVVVLEVHQRDLGVPPAQTVARHVALDPLALDDPVELALELHRVGLELLQHVGPAGQHVLGHGVGVDRVHIARRVVQVLELELKRADRPSVLQLHRLA